MCKDSLFNSFLNLDRSRIQVPNFDVRVTTKSSFRIIISCHSLVAEGQHMELVHDARYRARSLTI